MLVGEPRLLGCTLDVHLDVAFSLAWRRDREFIGELVLGLFMCFSNKLGVHKRKANTHSHIPSRVG